MTQFRGCDISRHQGNIDFNKLKDSVDFIIIRASYGFFNIDDKAQEYINNCERYNIPYGLYHYSYARNIEEAQREVLGFLQFADSQKYRPTYPLILDMEDADNWKKENGNPSNEMYVAISEYFLASLEDRGYYAMLYANKDWFINRLNNTKLERFDKWLAHWDINNPSLKCGMWQYTSKGKLTGINGNVDLDFAFQDYPEIIKRKGLNKTGQQVNQNETRPLVSGTLHKIGETVHFDYLYTDSYGNGLVKSRVHYGKITKIYTGRKAPYLIGNGTGYVSDSLII